MNRKFVVFLFLLFACSMRAMEASSERLIETVLKIETIILKKRKRIEELKKKALKLEEENWFHNEDQWKVFEALRNQKNFEKFMFCKGEIQAALVNNEISVLDSGFSSFASKSVCNAILKSWNGEVPTVPQKKAVLYDVSVYAKEGFPDGFYCCTVDGKKEVDLDSVGTGVVFCRTIKDLYADPFICPGSVSLQKRQIK